MRETANEQFRGSLENRVRTAHEQELMLRDQIAELQAQLRTVQRRREAAEELLRLEFGEDALAGSAAGVAPGRLAGASWSDAIRAVLTNAGRPLHIRDIWRELEAGGFRTGARDPLRSVVTMCLRDELITKAAPNTYGLAGAPQGHDPVAETPIE